MPVVFESDSLFRQRSGQGRPSHRKGCSQLQSPSLRPLPAQSPPAPPPAPRTRFLSPLSQTCQLALDLIAWRRNQQGAGEGSKEIKGPSDANPYLSVDPAPSCGEGTVEGRGGDERGEGQGTEEMGKRLRDKDRSLFERYRYHGDGGFGRADLGARMG